MHKEGALNKTFLRNISILLFVNLLIKPIYIFGIDAQVQNMLGESQYGLYFGLFNFCMLFQIILDPGILNYNSQLISKNVESVGEHFKNIFGSKLILVFIFVTGVFLISLLMSYPRSYYQYFPGILVILILSSFLSYLRSHFSALGRYSHEAWLSGLDKLLMIIVLGYFLFIRKEISIHLFISGQIIALLISCLIFIFYLKGLFALSVRFSLKETIELIKKTVPYALVLLLMTLYTRLDGVMLERLLDDSAYSAGVYARSFRLLDAANMIAILFATLMLPMFSKLMSDRIQLKSLVEEVSRLLFVVCIMVCMVCWHYSKEIMDLIYVNNTSEHYLVFKFLLLSFFAMGMSNIFGCLFLASQKLKQINILFFIGILMNLSLNYLLIPEKGAFGAVVATLVTQFFVFIGQAVLAMQVFKLKFHNKTILGFALIYVASIFIFKIFKTYLHWSWMIELLMISFLMLVLAFLCGFLRFSILSKR